MTDPGLWRISPAPYADVRRLAAELGVSDVLAQVLVRRGLGDPAAARAFLHPEFQVHDPYLMAGMAEARARIDQALKRSEPVAVHGDYDADGITATFLLVSVLRELGADVRWRLPNRFSEGYGVSSAAVAELAEAGVKLLITVDCGINARDEVAQAQSLGMDVIVTDHHELEGDLPACVVVSPKLGGYPCEHLAGVGVAFKLAHALLEDRGDELVDLPLALRPYSDLVAVGTIADVVPLTDENRVLTAIGLGRLRSAPRPGLAALLEVAGGKSTVDAGAVGFRLGPRLNAAGRLEDASIALELLGAPDRETALPLALRLNELNRERQTIEAAMLEAAVAMVPDPPPPALVLSAPDWHEGVVGIVASRVAERFHRPAILLSEGDDVAKGSGRSIPAFDLLGAVERSSGHLLTFGGHRAACGLRLRCDAIPAFRDAFVAEAAAALSPDDLQRVRHVDAIVGGGELTLGLADELELLAPHGFGNRQVTLLLHGAEVVQPRLTRDKRHAQYRVRCEAASCQAIHFNFGDLDELLTPGRHDVALALSKNDYNGAVSAQVQVRSLHRLEPAAVGPVRDGLRLSRVASACAASALWRELLQGDGAAAADETAEAAAAARGPARRARRRPPRRPARPARRSPSSRACSPAASARSCWPPTWPVAGRCSAGTCSRRGSASPAPTSSPPARSAPPGSPAPASSWPRPRSRSPTPGSPGPSPTWCCSTRRTPRRCGRPWPRRPPRRGCTPCGALPRPSSPPACARASWTSTRPCAACGRPSPRRRAGLTTGSSRNSLGKEPSSLRSQLWPRRSRHCKKPGCSSSRAAAAIISSDRSRRSTSPGRTRTHDGTTGIRHQTSCGPA